MRTQRVATVCVICFVLSGCKGKPQNSLAEPNTQRVTIPQAETKPSPPQEASLAVAVPANASETQARALHRYNENAWFIQEALQVAQPNETLKSAISTLVKAGRPDWDHANPSHAQIRGAEISTRLRPWVETAHSPEPPKEAAVLLVADRIVVMEEEDGNLEPAESERPATEGQTSVKRPKSSAQLELEKLGARFTYEDGSERYFYQLNWLQQAYELDPKGRAGELAFLALMKRGFDTSQTCANGSDQFREVIRRGTEFLREHHSGEVEAQVHFAMGDAYRDIVALAEGLQADNYADPNNYKAEAPAARAKAVAEYHAGLALDNKSDASLIAKEQLRSLEAGQAPHDARFYCQLLD